MCCMYIICCVIFTAHSREKPGKNQYLLMHIAFDLKLVERLSEVIGEGPVLPRDELLMACKLIHVYIYK